MSGLAYKDKMKVEYYLYEKDGTGAVTKVGGIKLREGCLLVPNNVCDDITMKLTAIGVYVKKLQIYANENLDNLQLMSSL
ncbi:MAG: hypothetical protein QME50_00110 [Candidatus Bathyarchaeota archaeon]|nr:hypothetical protein [Candidatus Bathyarchaeota archaeon]